MVSPLQGSMGLWLVAAFPALQAGLSHCGPSARPWESVEDARRFRNEFNYPTAPIYAVRGVTTFKGDMNLLRLGGTILGAWLHAQKYWKGHSSTAPRWEVLLIPPVSVESQVE